MNPEVTWRQYCKKQIIKYVTALHLDDCRHGLRPSQYFFDPEVTYGTYAMQTATRGGDDVYCNDCNLLRRQTHKNLALCLYDQSVYRIKLAQVLIKNRHASRHEPKTNTLYDINTLGLKRRFLTHSTATPDIRESLNTLYSNFSKRTTFHEWINKKYHNDEKYYEEQKYTEARGGEILQ